MFQSFCFINQSIMKSHERQISQQIKTSKPNAVEISPYKFEVFSKNFKKKYQLCEPSASSSSNIAKHFVNEKKNENKHSPQRYNSKDKSERKKSFEKFTLHTRTTQRTSLNINATNQQSLSTKTKLMKITNILCQSTFGGNKSLLLQTFKSQDQYEKLVKQWQNLDMFDQVDRLIQKLISYYWKVIEDMLLQTNQLLKQKLNRYEETIQYLVAQNAKVTHQLELYSHLQQVLLPIKERLLSEYQKNQWNTFIFNSLALKSFNIQAFVRQTSVYKRWIDPVLQNLDGFSKEQLSFVNEFQQSQDMKSQQKLKKVSKSMGEHITSQKNLKKEIQKKK